MTLALTIVSALVITVLAVAVCAAAGQADDEIERRLASQAEFGVEKRAAS